MTLTRSQRALASLAIVAVLVWHALVFSPWQLLWACHLASASIIVGMVSGRARLVAIGIVFHAGEGIPAYVLDVVASGFTTPSSILLHVVPLAAGMWALWRQPFPTHTVLAAWLLHLGATALAYFFTPADLNIMVAHAPYFTWFSSLAWTHAVNAAVSLACLLAGWACLHLVWRRWR